MIGFFIYDHIRSDRRVDRLENKLMSRDFRDFESVKVEKKVAEKTIDKMTEPETDDEEQKDYEKFNSMMEEDWNPEELDYDKVKEQLKQIEE